MTTEERGLLLRGVRDKCDLGLALVPAADNETDLASRIAVGDIAFFKTSDQWLSRTITGLDGYWTHSGIIVETDSDQGPMIVHSVLQGTCKEPLSVVAASKSDGFAVGRPKEAIADPTLGRRAAQVAEDLASSDVKSKYGGGELGEACAVLIRGNLAAVKQALRQRLGQIVRESTAEPELWDRNETFEATCSGLVYHCYSAAGVKLDFTPSPGLRRDDEHGTIRTADSSDFVVPGHPDLVTAESMRSSNEMKIYSRLMAQALPGFFDGMTTEQLPIAKTISPGDLWTTTDPTTRCYGSADAKAKATAFVADCPG